MATRDGGGSPPDHVEDERNEASDSESGSSYAGSAGSAPDTPVCRYRSAEFHDQECSGFFDCPTHILPRVPLVTSSTDTDSSNVVAESTGSSTPIHATRPSGDPSSSVAGTQADSPALQEPTASTIPRQTNTPQHEQQVQTATVPFTGDEDLASRTASAMTRVGDVHDTVPLPLLQSDATGDRGQPLSGTNSRPSSSHSSLRGNAPEFRPVPPSQPVLATQSQPPDQVSPQVRPRPRQSEFRLPHWQPDAAVTYCPICHTQFSIFVRKHHCRKCGRVVCANCSPHRIIIPHQYIVRPPSDAQRASGLWGEERGIADLGGVPGGGERVRLCNPCVPDPNTTPPQAPNSPNSSQFSPRSGHQRAQSSADQMGYFQAGSLAGQYPGFNPTSQMPPRRDDTMSRSRSATVNSNSMFPRPLLVPSPGPSHSRSSLFTSHLNDPRIQTGTPGSHPVYIPAPQYSSSSGQQQLSQNGQPYYYNASTLGTRRTYASRPVASSSSSSSAITNTINDRPLPPRPQIPEEDECPVCHQELPSRHLANFESLREAHVRACITSHSSYSPQPAVPGEAGLHGTPPNRVARRTGMFPYVATEKDCVDSAECTICFEEYEVGVAMARLECLCRFHRACISAWFVKNPGRCPVHQHDSFGY